MTFVSTVCLTCNSLWVQSGYDHHSKARFNQKVKKRKRDRTDLKKKLEDKVSPF